MKRAVLLTIITVLVAGVLCADRRVALVIGNGDYQSFGNLRNPPNDATDIAAALQAIGFEVDLFINADRMTMEEAVLTFGKRLGECDDTVGLFFFAGHGIQSKGKNYLIPAQARIPSESFLPDRSISTQVILDEMQQGGSTLNIVVLDACRDNPFGWERSGSRGLIAVTHQPPGSIIAYATSAGSIALDGDGRNGVFTAELLKHITTPELDVTELFRRTGQGVRNMTNGQQVPAIYSQFFDLAYLVERATIDYSCNPIRDEILVEGGVFLMGSANDGFSDERPVHQVTLDSFFMMKTEVTYDEYEPFVNARGQDLPYDYGWGSGDRPIIGVNWYTSVEYANWLSEHDNLTPAYRIVGKNVWLISGNGWRLPTEAEWEYAARGGKEAQDTVYAGSDDAEVIAWYGMNEDGGKTQPVAGKQPNELGLYDMSGNVSEWCWDWWGAYSREAVVNPLGSDTGAGRIIRGGNWSDSAKDIRITNRHSIIPRIRNDEIGFRLVRPADMNQ